MGSCPVEESPRCYYTSNCYTDPDIWSSDYQQFYTDYCNDLDDLDCQETIGAAVW